MKFRVRARAKINLFLEITGERGDGLHYLRSIVAPISLYDTLFFQEAEPDVLEISSAEEIRFRGLPWPVSIFENGRNIMYSAAEAIRKAANCKAGARITLEKHIPVKAGMGGGSADAAGTLIGLNRLWRLELDTAALVRIGAGIGCDVPALVQGGIVEAQGVGEILSPVREVSRRPVWLTLVNPGFGVSTADAYGRWQGRNLDSTNAYYDAIVDGLKRGSPEAMAQGLYNELEKPVLRKYPLLSILKNELTKAGALGALLTGSGPTLYGIASDRRHAAEIAERMRRSAQCPLWVETARIVADEYECSRLPDGVMAAHGPLEARV